MDRIHLTTLGHLELTLNGQPALVRRRKELALLAYLARRAPRPADRSSLASMLWGESEDAKARHSLSQALSDLRSVLGDDVRLDLASVRLGGSALVIDATEFENDVRQEYWSDAVARWQGPFLAGLDDLGDERWGAWLEAERTVLSAKLGVVLGRLASEREARGAWDEAIPWAEQLVELQPYDEDAVRRLLTLLISVGREVDAKACLADFELRRSRDLDVGPSPALRDLVERASREPAPINLGPRGLLSPDLVGRGEAFGVLSAAWDRLQGGDAGHVVVVGGDEGQGKSRLITEFKHTIRRRHPEAVVLEANVFASEQQVAFSALRPLLARLVEAPGAPAAAPGSLAALARITPEVGELYHGLPVSEVEGELGPHLERVTAAVAEEGPLLMLIDDAPLADPESQAAIGGLVRRPPRGLLLIVAGRTDAWNQSGLAADITTTSHLDRVELTSLSRDETRSVLTSMAPFTARALAELSRRLHDDTGGAPGRIEHLVHRMADDGMIALAASGEWDFREVPAGALPIPLGVRGTMESRLRRLGVDARALAEAAAVLGPDIDLSLLEAISDLRAEAWQGAVADLMSHRVLREHGARSGHYAFLSESHRRAVYELTPPSRRMRLHRRALLALKRKPSDTATRAAIASHRALAGSPSGIRRSWVVAGTATLLAAVALLAVVIRGQRAAHVEPGTPILLADVRNLTGDTLLDQSVYTAAVVSLQQSRRIWVFPRSRIPEVLARMGMTARDTTIDEGLAREVAQRENIRIVVQLAITRVDPILLLTSRLLDARSGRDLRTFETRVSERNDILSGLTRLLRSTRSGLGETGQELAGQDSLPAVSTASLEALKAFAEGQRAWSAADYPRARARWERAIELDTSFALAHVTMAEWHYLMNDRVRGRASLDRAHLHAGRLTERERLALDQVSAYQLGKNPEAIAAARTTAERYPEPTTIANYAGTLFRSGNCRDAIPVYRRVVAMSPSHRASWINLATCLKTLDENEEALEAYGQAERADSLALLRDNINHEWGGTFVRLGRPLAAESAFRRILGRSEPGQRMRGYRSLAWLAMYQGRYREAIQLFRESNVTLQSDGRASWVSVFRNQVNMAHAAISRNDSAGARAMLREARRLIPAQAAEPAFYYWMAYGYFRLGENNRTREMLDLIGKSLTPTDHQDSVTHRLVSAWIAETERRPSAVIDLLGQLTAEFREAVRKIHLGRAYIQLQHPDSALRLFEAAREEDNWGYEGQEEWVRLPLEIAAAALQLGDSARAARALGEFLTLWQHADEDLLELRLAKDQLARLTGSRAN